MGEINLMLQNKILPHDEQAEKALLGGMLLDSKAIPQVMEILRGEMFYSTKHQKIFKAANDLWADGKTVDTITLNDALKGEDIPDCLHYLMQLQDAVISATGIMAHAEIVLEKYRLRKIIVATNIAERNAYSEESSTEILNGFSDSIINLQSNRKEKNLLEQLHHLNDFIDTKDSENYIVGVPSGLTDLDRCTCGFEGGELIVIAARPGFGKTAMAVNISRHLVKKQGMTIGFFSLEMGEKSMLARYAAQEAKVNMQSIRNGTVKFNKVSMDKYSKAVVQLGLYLDRVKFEDKLFDSQSICARAQIWKMKHNIGALFVDYLQIMNHRDSGTTSDNIGNTTRDMKQLAMHLNIPVFLLSQLTRENARESRKPRLSDLRSSGSIEQDSDQVIFVHHEFPPDRYGDMNMIIGSELIIAKNRQGPTTSVLVTFLSEYALFVDNAKETV